MNDQTALQTRIRLIPRLLGDDAIDHKFKAKELHKVIVCPEREQPIAMILGYKHCLVYNQASKPSWQCYEMPATNWGWTMERDGTRLWSLTSRHKLTAFDFNSGEWLQFNHGTPYENVLYAERDTVMVQWSEMQTIIDVLRLQGEHLKRVAHLSVALPFEHPAHVKHIVFLPDENRFLVLVSPDLYMGIYPRYPHSEHEPEHMLLSLEWDGKAEIILRARGEHVHLSFPFFVAVNDANVIYADVREKPIKLKQLDLSSMVDWSYPSQLSQISSNTFVFGEDLVIALTRIYLGEIMRKTSKRSSETVAALIKLGGEAEMLCRSKKKRFWQNRLGRFLIEDSGDVYDLVAKQKLRDMLLSTMLHQAIQDEFNQRPFATAPMLSPKEEVTNLGPTTFECTLREHPIHLTEIPVKSHGHHVLISSSKGDLCVFKERGVWLFPRDRTYAQLMSPQPRDGWWKVTFDEKDRVWLCDGSGQYVGVFHCDGSRENVGLVLSYTAKNLEVDRLAAYADHIVMVRGNSLLTIYHYSGESLEKRFDFNSLKSREMLITSIKPDVSAKGWWLIMQRQGVRSTKKRLEYLDLETNRLETVMEVPENIKVFGNRPDRLYFAYLDELDHLHYTLDPRDEWQKVNLQDVLRSQSAQQDRVYHISMCSIDDKVFAMFESMPMPVNLWQPRTYFFLRLLSSGVELISAFRSEAEIQLARWKDCLLLCNAMPLVSATEHAAQAQCNNLPENNGILFYHPNISQFSTEPHSPYIISKTLSETALNRTLKNSPKFSL